MKAGKAYELLIEKLYKSLAENAVVKQDDKIYGHNSKEERQIDVSIRYKFADIEQLIVVEAKDHKHPADIKIVDGFIAKVNDVKATKGVLISAKGFTKKALEYARSANIDALTVHSALEKKWETVLQIPVIRHEFRFELLDAHFMYEIRRFAGQEVRIGESLYSYDGGKTSLNMLELIELHYPIKATNSKLLSRDVLEINFAGSGLSGLFNYLWVPIESGVIKFRYQSLRKYYRYYSPQEYLLVKNHLTGTSEIKSTVTKVELSVSEDEWIRYKNEQDLPIFGDLQTFFFDYFFFDGIGHCLNFILKRPSENLTNVKRVKLEISKQEPLF